MINLLFWNLAKNKIENYVADIIRENDIDVCVFAEYSGCQINSILSKLYGQYQFFDGMGGCNKIIVIAKSSYNIAVRREHNRYIIYSIKHENEQYILAGIHLPDNLHSKSDDRKAVIRDLTCDIKEQEKLLNHDNTIVIGDFNASPFDSELVQKDAFNAVLFKDLIMKTEYVTYNGRKYRRFYNPMLDNIAEDNSNYGSFYYSSGIETLYWYCYDQVLMRKVLIDHFISAKYCKSIKGKNLLKQLSPNREISDHLPLIVKFERRIINE